jgi:hypothetical protein
MQDEKHAPPLPAPPDETARDGQDEPPVLMIKIDRATYEVAVFFSRTSDETMGDKIRRLIENETVTPSIPSHQTSIPDTEPSSKTPCRKCDRLPERKDNEAVKYHSPL